MTDRIKEVLATTAKDWSLHERNCHHIKGSGPTPGASLPNRIPSPQRDRLSTAGLPQVAGLAVST